MNNLTGYKRCYGKRYRVFHVGRWAALICFGLIAGAPQAGVAAAQQTPTTLNLTSSDVLIPFGGSVTLTATVSPNPAESGQVTFYDGATVLGTVPINENSSAAFTATGLALGAHPLSALFFSESFLQSSAALNVSVYGSTNPSAFAATPNPILTGRTYLPDGVTTISWYAPGVETVEIHLGSPDGLLFTEGGFSGNAITGDWVSDGMMFYLQDTTGGKPTAAANTIAVLAVRVAQQALLAATQNPIVVQPGQFIGETSIEWDATAGVSNTEIHLDSPDGLLFAAGGTSGVAPTGNWVADGMTFFLQDTTNGKALTGENTLGALVVNLVQTPPSQLSASPNPIPPTSVVNGQMAGSTTLTWGTSLASAVEIHLGSPTGSLIASGGSTGSIATGLVTEGTAFYLQMVVADNGIQVPLAAADTLGVAVVHISNPVTFEANPNPITDISLASGNETGVTTLQWNAPPSVIQTEIHLASPTGPLFAQGGATGSATTGPWVTDGMTFYLQDTTNSKPLTVANTLATLMAHLQHQVQFTASPNPISSQPGKPGLGVTTLSWNVSGVASVEIHLGNPDGLLFAAGGPSGMANTGDWVTNGMKFYLQDTTDGRALTAANTLATVVAQLQ